MNPKLRWALLPLAVLAGLSVAAAALIAIAVILAQPQLPSLDALTDYRPKVPLRVYTADGHLIGEFGEERRSVVAIKDVPPMLKNAILAAEDDRFYQHGGVDAMGVLRAAYANFVGGGKRQGASTITMQVARNFYLSSEKTLSRKLYEVLLAFKIENNLTKDQILELYINQIYLGQRAYGFGAASQVYYGKPLKDISVAEAAMLAGLPKAPSTYNPVANPKRAKLRQQYVLRRMHELGHIDGKQHEDALKQPMVIRRDSSVVEYAVRADHVAEMARQAAYDKFQDDAYTKGVQVITTIRKADQEAAYRALRQGVLDYDRRHGYRGPEGYVELRANEPSPDDDRLEDLLADYPDSDELLAAIVLQAEPRKVTVYRRGGEQLTLTGDGLKFAQRFLDAKAATKKQIRRGAVVRVTRDDKGNWAISQIPDVEGAFVALNPGDGSIRALVGGFDFNRSKFNHVTQAWRQPGSSFKPFIYSAALEKGFTPSSIIEDGPITISAEETGSQAWEPKNYDGTYDGPMRMRTALAKSKNMVSIRILQSISPQYAQDYAARFGFDADKHPPYLTMALGAGAATPWQMVSAYGVFANGGYRVTPYVIKEIRNGQGQAVSTTSPQRAGDENLRVIDARNAYLMDSMLRDVTIYGTAARSSVTLKRRDLAGKTGTTNDYVDAWFAGYQQQVVGVAWIGFDQPKRLGSGETGGQAALPIWINYMARALKDVPEATLAAPEGLTSVEVIDPTSNTGVKDLMYKENVPVEPPSSPANAVDRPERPSH